MASCTFGADQQEILNAIKDDNSRKRSSAEKQKAKANKKAFDKFSASGWIPYLEGFNLAIPDIIKLSELSPEEIDDYIWSRFTTQNDKKCKILIKRLEQIKYDSPHYFTCAKLLYDRKEYMGCAMMAFALIEQRLRYSGASPHEFGAFLEAKFGVQDRRFGIYNEHPTKYLLNSAVGKLLEEYYREANDFVNEPSEMRRAFLMHGMAKREYTQRDCIKLFSILDFICKFEGRDPKCPVNISK